MPKVVREDIDNLNAVITVTVAKSDYEPKFKQQLSKYQKQAHMKGFRRGKTPISVLKKMYGKGLLSEIINEKIQEALLGYLREEDLKILGQPIPSEDEGAFDFDLKFLEDYDFKFDIGLAPEFELAGVDKDNSFEKYKINFEDELIDEEIESSRKRLGEVVPSEGQIQTGDLIKFHAQELLFGTPKADGLEGEFSILEEKLVDEAREALLNINIGDSLEWDLSNLEVDTDGEYAKKYYLKLEEEAAAALSDLKFRLTIKEATHVAPAELNEAFFAKLFNDDSIKTLEEARNKFRENAEGFYEQQALALLHRDFQKDLMEKNELSFPDAFLKRWLILSNENISEANVEQSFTSLAKDLKWSLINEKIIELADLSLEEEEVEKGLENRVRGYLQGQPMGDDFIQMMVQRLKEDEQQVNQVRDEVMGVKVRDAIIERVSLVDKDISSKDFEKVFQEIQEEIQNERAAHNAALTEEEE